MTLEHQHYRHDAPVPFRSITAQGVLLEPRYLRNDLIGGTFSNAFGKTTLRADADGVFKAPEVGWVLGADYVHSADLLLSMQWFGPRLWERPASALRGQREYQLTLLARQKIADDTLQLKGLGLYGVSDRDSAASVGIARRATLRIDSGR